MKDNQYKPSWKNIYIVQEQPIKQSNLSLAARSKIINKTGSNYSSQNPKNYGPCIPFNQNCECSLEELQRQEQILKNREIEERIGRGGNEESQQEENEQVNQLRNEKRNLQDQLTGLQRSFQDLQEENHNVLQVLGINNLGDLPDLLNGESLTDLLNRATQRQSSWWWSNNSTNLDIVTRERDHARQERDEFRNERDNAYHYLQNVLQIDDLNNLPVLPQGENLNSLLNRPTREQLQVELDNLEELIETKNTQIVNLVNERDSRPNASQAEYDELVRKSEELQQQVDDLTNEKRNLEQDKIQLTEEKTEVLEFLHFYPTICPAIDTCVSNRDELHKLQKFIYQNGSSSFSSSLNYKIRVSIIDSDSELDISKLNIMFDFFRLINFSNHPLTLKINQCQKSWISNNRIKNNRYSELFLPRGAVILDGKGDIHWPALYGGGEIILEEQN